MHLRPQPDSSEQLVGTAGAGLPVGPERPAVECYASREQADGARRPVPVCRHTRLQRPRDLRARRRALRARAPARAPAAVAAPVHVVRAVQVGRG